MDQHSALPPVELMPKDLSAYRKGNRGVDYVHTFDSGRPGPHVIVNALTHGNEFCGMIAVTTLFERGIRPLRGKLTLVFANVDAYHRFDPAQPFESRFVERDFNRVWDLDTLEGPDETVDVKRARALRHIYAEADALLDLHSTSYAVPPMLIHEPHEKLRPLARHLRSPLHHVILPGVKHPGRPLIQYGAFGDPAATPVALVVECGQHFARTSGDLAIGVTMRFLDYAGMIPADLAAQYAPLAGEPQRYEVMDVLVAKTDQFRFAAPFVGFEELAGGALIAVDGDEEIRAPKGGCTLIMPARRILKGRDVVSLARPLA
ncbi:MAG TPA: succinylglutamate desuccinylase/aspartoacylase family protein [Ferrovibrio sp.]|jgi:predicted deacylase|uniref:succinylglutamate desuccinylase/aspartoacylase domain-containing protein n=1 Tax=Ferrovibrio sp. TaxID=1917215 RepID=UPI002ED137A0